MKERGPWRFWSTYLLILAGILRSSVVQCQSYDGARGDSGDNNAAALGFSGVVQRHDGYVKGETPTIPQTSFTCSAQPYNPGLYADIETQCQVYHVCFEDRQESFLCGPGTNFNQRILACDFWYNFDCQDSPNFYSANADIGKVPGKVPESVFRPGQSRVPQQPQPQQPSYPSFPQQPAQPPSGGSYPPRVSVPPPPPRTVQPQPPRIQPQEPIQPQQPRIPQEPIDPHPPHIAPQPPRVAPQPPRVSPQPPRIAPQPPRISPQPPAFRPDPPRIQPQPPRVQPQPPRVQPQPPRVYPPPPAPQPQPPAFRPQPRPDPPQVSVQPQYPRVPQGSGQPPKVRPPPTQQLRPTQQEEDNGYQFDGYNPSRPSLPPPQPPRNQPPRPVFPPVVSPPRVSRPPLTPPIIRQPEVSRPRVPTFETRPEFHPDSHLKGNTGYIPPQQPRDPQPSRPVGSGYPSYPVPQRPVDQRPVAQQPVSQRPVAQRPVAQRPVAQRPVAQRPVAQRPIEKPSRPAYQPPQTVQQEHVDTEYVPPPPPPREPSRPSTSYVPPPPPPVQQEVTNVGFTKPPQQPSRPAYVPPPVAQKPVDNGYGKPQPPGSPSVIREQQKPAAPPPSRPQVSVGSRQPQQPQRPKPVFPPASDHPNANIKGGPGYHQPPPQIPRFEPTRISRPSNPEGGYQVPPQTRPRPVSSGISTTAVKQTGGKTPSASGQGVYKPPQQERVKKPSDPPRTVYQPPIQVIDHPQADIKGVVYDPSRPKPTQRVQSPSTSVVGVKRPQASGGYKQPQVQRPRAPVVVSRPQPPSLPTTSIKKTSPVDSQIYEKPRPQPPAPIRVKQPSSSQVQTVSRPSQPRFPTHGAIDHPNANVKGGPGYNQPQLQPVGVSRPSGPPSSPSTSYEQKTTSSNQGRGSGSGYPSPPSYPSRGDGGSVQQVIQQQDYKPIRTSPPSSVKTVQKVTAVKDSSSYPRPPASSQHSVLINKQSKPDYEAGSSYTRGPDTYPKPEFGKPHTPVSTPSRLSPNTKQGSPSQNTITRAQNKPASSRPSVSAGSGSDVRPDYPFNQVPGHQPPHERQVFPHRENPDHPNESLKGSAAYRPPPPAGFQAEASETQEQKVVPEPEPAAASLHGDTGSE